MKKIIYLISLLLISGISMAQDFKLPAYQTFKLKNGLTVYLMEQHDVPMINVSMVIPAGAIKDGNKAGLAALTAASLKHGTAKMTRSQLNEELDFSAASINSFASKETAGIRAEFAAKDRDKVMGILLDLLVTPSFDTTEFNKEKRLALVGLEQKKESPSAVIGSAFDKFLYGNHVYGNTVSGTMTSVGAITPADVKTFYQQNYIPNGSAIAIVGAFNSKEMKTYITKLLGGWKKGAVVADEAGQAITKPTTNRVLLINKADAKETTFIIGSPGISRNNPDYVAIDVINTLFGGRFTSMLNDELRVNSGLTYGARSRFSAMRNGGSFAISTFTASATTEPAIDKALETLKKLHASGIDDTALQSAKNYVKGQFPPDFETSGQLAGLLTDMFWFNFNESYINNFQKTVDGLTLEKARAIIKQYFPADKLQFVLVGKASDIKKIAEKYGPVTEMQITEEPKKAF